MLEAKMEVALTAARSSGLLLKDRQDGLRAAQLSSYRSTVVWQTNLAKQGLHAGLPHFGLVRLRFVSSDSGFGSDGSLGRNSSMFLDRLTEGLRFRFGSCATLYM